MDKDMKELLLKKAVEMRERAYAPYSGFTVGAALLCKNGEIYTGCNIENQSFTPTVCAERTAVFKAVSDGIREFEAICIAGGKAGTPTRFSPPCGVCRQVLSEFVHNDFKVLIAISPDEFKEYTFDQIMPLVFDLNA